MMESRYDFIMRRFWLTLILTVLAWAAFAEEKPATPAPQQNLADIAADPTKRAAFLDELFHQLKNSKSAEQATKLDALIQALLQQTGSEAAELFLQWGGESFEHGDMPQALDYFSGAVALSPNTVEPYHRRAAVFYALDEYALALADLERANAIEPRHTGVILGLAVLFSDLGRDKEALDAYEHALAINPQLSDARRIADELKKKVEGQEL